ncbi:MAG: hypothetical protein R3268_14480, partial [Acidiferrobacterales bacterium]|nr:hypothetical protein [Acidiferrobacterales bacterium]
NDFLRSKGYDDLAVDSDEWFHFTRRVLCEVVECFVCTSIENQIKPYRTLTSHNPIRVYEVDGRHLTNWKEQPTLRPSTVLIPEQTILQTAARLYAERHTGRGEIVEYLYPSQHAIRVSRAQGWD